MGFDYYERVLCHRNDRLIFNHWNGLTEITNLSDHTVSWIKGDALKQLMSNRDYIYKGATLYTNGTNVYTQSGSRFEFLDYQSTMYDAEVNVYERYNSYIKVMDKNLNMLANLMILYKDATVQTKAGSKVLSIKSFDKWYWESKQKPLSVIGNDKYNEDGIYTHQNVGINLDTGESIFISDDSLKEFIITEEKQYGGYYKWFDKFYLMWMDNAPTAAYYDWCRWNRLLMLPEGTALTAVSRTTPDDYFINLAEWPLAVNNGDFVSAYNFGYNKLDIHNKFKGKPCMLQVVSNNLNNLGIVLKDCNDNVYIAFNADSKVKPGSIKCSGILT